MISSSPAMTHTGHINAAPRRLSGRGPPRGADVVPTRAGDNVRRNPRPAADRGWVNRTPRRSNRRAKLGSAAQRHRSISPNCLRSRSLIMTPPASPPGHSTGDTRAACTQSIFALEHMIRGAATQMRPTNQAGRGPRPEGARSAASGFPLRQEVAPGRHSRGSTTCARGRPRCCQYNVTGAGRVRRDRKLGRGRRARHR